MRFAFFLAILALSSCRSSKIDPEPAVIISERLRAQSDRIRPLFLRCDGMAAESGPNSVTQRPDCSTGDSVLWTSLAIAAKRDASMEASIKASVDDEGKPWRSPEHRKAQQEVNAFSRDHYTGLLLYAVATKDKRLIASVYDYARARDFKLCPKDTDDRCFLTPNMLALTSDVFGYLGISKGSELTFNRRIDELVLNESAKKAEGYEAHLVSINVLIRLRVGKANAGYRDAVKTLLERHPDNLWYGYLNNVLNDNSQAEADRIGSELASLMERWPEGDRSQWSFQREKFTETSKDAMGAEFVMLADLLLGAGGD